MIYKPEFAFFPCISFLHIFLQQYNLLSLCTDSCRLILSSLQYTNIILVAATYCSWYFLELIRLIIYFTSLPLIAYTPKTLCCLIPELYLPRNIQRGLGLGLLIFKQQKVFIAHIKHSGGPLQTRCGQMVYVPPLAAAVWVKMDVARLIQLIWCSRSIGFLCQSSSDDVLLLRHAYVVCWVVYTLKLKSSAQSGCFRWVYTHTYVGVESSTTSLCQVGEDNIVSTSITSCKTVMSEVFWHRNTVVILCWAL